MSFVYTGDCEAEVGSERSSDDGLFDRNDVKDCYCERREPNRNDLSPVVMPIRKITLPLSPGFHRSLLGGAMRHCTNCGRSSPRELQLLGQTLNPRAMAGLHGAGKTPGRQDLHNVNAHGSQYHLVHVDHVLSFTVIGTLSRRIELDRDFNPFRDRHDSISPTVTRCCLDAPPC